MKEKTYPVISRNPDDLDVPGVQVEFTADEAERWGAFEETAMSEEDAWESNAELAMVYGQGDEDAEPYFIPDDEGPLDPPAPPYRTASAREIFGLRDGEDIFDGIERRAREQADAAEQRQIKEG